MIIQRKEAKEKGHKRYFTGVPCVNGHLSERLTSNYCCLECIDDHQRSKLKTRPPKLKADGLYCPTRRMSREEALQKGLEFFFTGEACKNGHITIRKVSNYTCQDCQLMAYHDQPEKYKTIQHNRRADNRDKINRYNNEWYYQTKEERKHLRKILTRAERKRNRGTHLANGAKRRAQKLKATPPWFEEEQIKRLFQKAQRLTKETGIPHHVHHVVPLQELAYVSGLHCKDNLVVVTDQKHKELHRSEALLKSMW